MALSHVRWSHHILGQRNRGGASRHGKRLAVEASADVALCFLQRDARVKYAAEVQGVRFVGG